MSAIHYAASKDGKKQPKLCTIPTSSLVHFTLSFVLDGVESCTFSISLKFIKLSGKFFALAALLFGGAAIESRLVSRTIWIVLVASTTLLLEGTELLVLIKLTSFDMPIVLSTILFTGLVLLLISRLLAMCT